MGLPCSHELAKINTLEPFHIDRHWHLYDIIIPYTPIQPSSRNLQPNIDEDLLFEIDSMKDMVRSWPPHDQLAMRNELSTFMAIRQEGPVVPISNPDRIVGKGRPRGDRRLPLNIAPNAAAISRFDRST